MVDSNPLVALWSWSVRFLVLVVLLIAAWPLGLIWAAWHVRIIIRDHRRRQHRGYNTLPQGYVYQEPLHWAPVTYQTWDDVAATHSAYDDRDI